MQLSGAGRLPVKKDELLLSGQDAARVVLLA